MVNTTTKETLFKLLYRVEPKSEFGNKDMGDLMTEDFIRKQLQVRVEATDAIKLAEAHMSMYYDKRHQLVELSGSAYIRLATGIKKGYQLPNSSSLSVIKTRLFSIK